tara:strand:+ start:629 stop:1081 length:453 start_codon:yes stop_codon:yes gene_type:complete
MLVKLDTDDWKLGYCKDDPVRPHLPLSWRVQAGREVYGLESDTGEVEAVICVGYTNDVPITEHELDYYSQAACQDGQHGNVAVFYTVWSYAKGAGRRMVLETAEYLKNERGIKRFVTLSPLTEMAERFHIRNGATLLAKGNECQNFEYIL